MKLHIKRLLTLWTLLLSMVTLHAQTNGSVWTCDFRQYQYDCTVYLTLTENGQPLSYNRMWNLEIGAIAKDGTCRGLIQADNYYQIQSRNIYMFRVWTNDPGETFTLKLYSRRTGYTYDLDVQQPLDFRQDFIGALKAPLTADVTLSPDEDIDYPSRNGDIWRCLYTKFQYDVPGFYAISVPEEMQDQLSGSYDLGAFIDGTCRGVTSDVMRWKDNMPVFALRIYTDNDLTGTRFRLFDRETRTIYELAPETPIQPTANPVGSISHPVVLKVVENQPEQPIVPLYPLTFIIDGKATEMQLAEGAAIEAPEVNPGEGRVFTGWKPALEPGATMPAKEMTYTAIFTRNRFTVTYYEADGSTVILTEDVDAGTALKAPEVPAREGHTFTGWSPALEEGATMPAENVSYTAQYERNTYTVTFVIDGEKVQKTVLFGDPIVAPETAKAGYRFIGWAADPKTETIVPLEEKMPAYDLTYTAKYEALSYTATFLSDVSSVAPLTLTLPYGADIKVPAAPTREGHTFVKWLPEVPATMPDHDLTFTPTFSRNSYKATFHVEGVDDTEATVPYEEAIPFPTVTREGCTFLHWANMKDGEVTAFTTMPAGDADFYAVFSAPLKFSAVFYDDAKNQVGDKLQVEYGSSLIAPAAPEKEGHTFTCWTPAVPATMPARNMTFRATYEVNNYTVTFKGEDGKVLAAYDLPYGTAITEIPTPTVTGKTFIGWDKELRKGETVVKNNVTFIARFDTDVYLLTFRLDGEEYVQTALKYGASIELPTPTKEGHTFSGWTFEGLANAPKTMPDQALVATGSFSINKHTLTFVNAEGEVIAANEVAYGAEIVAPKVEQTGYTFQGWVEAIAKTMPDADLTYTAKPLKVIDYHVRYMTYDNGAEEPTLFRDIVKHYGESLDDATLDNLTIEGYDCTAWEWTDGKPATMPATDLTVICSRNVHQRQVTFKNGEEILLRRTYDYGTPIEHPANPTKEGHTFTGWSPQVAATVPDVDVEYMALFQTNTHFVNFLDYNGKVLSSVVTAYGEEIESIENPARTGYDFLGWDPAFTADATMPDRDVTYTATYKEHKYKVQFVEENGETPIQSYKMTYGAVINVEPEAPEVTGKVFAGWTPDFVAGHTAITQDETFKAVYKENPHAITYMIDGKVFYTQMLVEGEGIVTPNVPEREGYTFSGWALEDDIEDDKPVPNTMPNTDVNVNGHYEINTYVVTFDMGDGYATEQHLLFNSAIEAPVPTRKGYTFLGWNTPVAQKVPAYDLTYTAKWQKNQYTVLFYDADGKTILSKQILTIGDDIVLPDTPARKGYTFKGWTPDVQQQMEAENLTYAATYSQNTYKLTYVLNGETYAEHEYVYGRALTCMPAVQEKGKTFSGWSYEPAAAFAGEAHVFPATMPDHDVVITATLTDKEDTFTTDEGIIYAVIDNDAVELIGLDDEGASGETPQPLLMPSQKTDSRMLRAARRAVSDPNPDPDPDPNAIVLTSTVTDSDGKEYTLKSIAAAAFQNTNVSSVTIPETVETIGEGALDSKSLNSITIEGSTMPDLQAGAFDTKKNISIVAPHVPDPDMQKAIEDLSDANTALALQTAAAKEDDKAKMEENYDITATVNGRTGVSPTGTGAHKYGETVVLSVPTVEGYDVTYSVNDAAPVSGNTYIVTAAADVKVVFTYTAQHYDVIYKIGDEVVKTVETTFGEALSTNGVTAEPREGYTFQGWGTVPATMPAHDVNVVGAYKKNEHSLTFEIDGVVATTQTVPYGTALAFPEIDKEGYSLEWTDTLPATMPDHAITVKGNYVFLNLGDVNKDGKVNILDLVLKINSLQDTPKPVEGVFNTGAANLEVPALLQKVQEAE